MALKNTRRARCQLQAKRSDCTCTRNEIIDMETSKWAGGDLAGDLGAGDTGEGVQGRFRHHPLSETFNFFKESETPGNPVPNPEPVRSKFSSFSAGEILYIGSGTGEASKCFWLGFQVA